MHGNALFITFTYMNNQTKTYNQSRARMPRMPLVRDVMGLLKMCIDRRLGNRTPEQKAFITAKVDLLEEDLREAGML